MITVWLVARGDGDTTYTISGSAADAPQPQTRSEALARCNAWNRERCWPKAVVIDHGRDWHIHLGADLPLDAGIHTELFDNFTGLVIGGILEFWSTLATPAGDASERSARRRPRRPRADG